MPIIKNIVGKFPMLIIITVLLLLNSFCFGITHSQKHVDLFFGQIPPGDSAISFDSGVTFPENRKPSKIVFAPNGIDSYCTVWGKKFAWAKTFLVKYENGKYSDPLETPYGANYSRDGKRIYFSSKRDTIKSNWRDIYYVENYGNYSYGEEKNLIFPLIRHMLTMVIVKM